MLERDHISSSLSFIKIENFEFEHISISRQMSFFSLSLSLKTSFWVLARTFWVFQVLLSSSFSKLQTIELEFHWVWNLSGTNSQVIEFWVACSSTRKKGEFVVKNLISQNLWFDTKSEKVFPDFLGPEFEYDIPNSVIILTKFLWGHVERPTLECAPDLLKNASKK